MELNLYSEKNSCDFSRYKIHFQKPKILGRFFHLTKNIRSHFGELHLLGRYNNNADFALHVRTITVLVATENLDVATYEL